MTKSTRSHLKRLAGKQVTADICVSNSKIPCLLGASAPKKRHKSVVYDRDLSKKMRKELGVVEVAYTNMASNLRTHAVDSPTILIPTVTEYLDLRKVPKNEHKHRNVPMQAP